MNKNETLGNREDAGMNEELAKARAILDEDSWIEEFSIINDDGEPDDCACRVVRVDDMRDALDRIEAAEKRERENAMKTAFMAKCKVCEKVGPAALSDGRDPEKVTAELREHLAAHDASYSALSNAAALREAVVALLSWVDDHCQIGAFDEGSTKEDIRREWDALNAAKDSVRAALAAPVRNVDRFETLDDARQAFQEMRGHRILADVELWDSMDEAGAFARWLFATVKEGGAK